MSREKWFIFAILVLSGGGGRCPREWFVFIVLLYVVPASLSCSLPFLPVGAWPDGCLVGGWGS